MTSWALTKKKDDGMNPSWYCARYGRPTLFTLL